MKSHDNIQAILANVRSLSETVLYRLRRGTDFIAAPNNSNPATTVRLQGAQVDHLKQLIACLMTENFGLLFNSSQPYARMEQLTNAVRAL